MSIPITKVYIDWDCVNWAGVFDFEGEYDEVTSYLKRPVIINRPRGSREAIRPAGTAEFALINTTKIFTPYNTESPIYGKVRVWLPCKIEIEFIDVTYRMYTGYINRIAYYPQKKDKYAYFYLTDGIDLLAKAIITQDTDDKTDMTDGAACDDILDAAGWSDSRRIIDYTGGEIIKLPDTFEFQKPE